MDSFSCFILTLHLFGDFAKSFLMWTTIIIQQNIATSNYQFYLQLL